MADYGYDEEEAAPQKRDNLFIWTVFILLLIGVAFACWLGSFYVFGHPEQPRAYRILKKLKKIEAPKRFEVTAGPQGDFLSAQKLFERFSKSSRLELERENAALLRNYISNYRETKKLVPYIRGRFTILDSYELSSKDVFQSGVVALAQSNDYPQVLIEHVFPNRPESVARTRANLPTGIEFPVDRTQDLAAVIHIERVYEGRLMFTVMPLLYPNYALRGGVGTFTTEPPPDLNLEAKFPITKGAELQGAFKRYTEFRRKSPMVASDSMTAAAAPPQGPELVRLDAIPEGVKVPTTGALPEMPVATPIPQPGRTRSAPPAAIAMNTTPRPAVREPVSTPSPLPSSPPLPVATPLPRVGPDGVPLTPFITSNPAPGLPSANSGGWKTYAPGRMPPGRTVSAREASELADRGDLGEKIYLRGQFVVTAVAENRAVVRPQGAVADPGRPATGTRILVEYPNGALPPNEGSIFARDESRPFEVRDVRRGADGQVTIWVREITAQ